jgi:hypothetical protein
VKRISDFKAFNDAQSENYLAAHTPKGKLFGSRFVEGSVMYRMLLCLSTVAKIVTGQLEVFARNMDVRQASELLQEREASVMIPERYARRDTIESPSRPSPLRSRSCLASLGGRRIYSS